ncbi:MAG: 4-carboxy-4-hydroxy-2-oxoadipate aldolase/oxaloacetate decarboxylase [Pseudomonadota bacterium]|nr:4-carboxy-4-hydroxy-2-oxoadipate aldolase/oxaloacetate decarboxylase [Pseudomonadota bacterium]
MASLLRLGSATLHEAQGQTGALAAAIKPLAPTVRLAGPALTVDAKPGDNLVIHHALTVARPGDVLVVDAKAYVDAGPWGDILTLAAQSAGIAGLVIDGAVRDSDSILAMGFPVFSRGLSIRAAQKNQPGHVNVPIICGGVAIAPGDWVMGDRDGVVAIPLHNVPSVIAAADDREAAEVALRQGIASGKSTVELLGLDASLRRVGLLQDRA